MPDINPQTPPQNPDATDGLTPPATNPKGSDGATNDDKITLTKEDYNNLIGQRDRTNNAFKDLSETVGTLEAKQAAIDKKEFLDSWLEDNKQTYPDLTVDDLMGAESPESLEDLAKARQRRYEDVVQEKLKNVERASPPVLSPEDRDAELKKLQGQPGSGSFQRMLDLQQNA